MNRNQAKELLPIIKAFSEGKVIESRCIKGDTSLWYDDKDPSFDDDFEYRIKPESKYRPFKDRQECWQEMQKHQPFGWIADIDSCRYILAVGEGSVVFKSFNSSDFCKSFDEVMDTYTFADGTPFGVKEEE